MGLLLRFLPVPNPQFLLKSINIKLGGLYPLLEGRGEVVASSGGVRGQGLVESEINHDQHGLISIETPLDLL